jgi:hypothetical protein
MRIRPSLPWIVALLISVGPAASGQCMLPTDDGFDTGCCGPVAPVLPAFPPVTMSADYGALVGCQQLFVVPPFQVQFGAPTFVLCDVALINVFIQLTPSDTISGFLVAKYSRTWGDLSTPVFGQVWRFLVNGDLTCASTNPITPCTTVLPRCAALNPQVHFDGHIDYACDPFLPNSYAVSFSLNHLQGCISHAPWSCISLTGPGAHVEASYHIVGPAPFNFAATAPAPQGPLVGEAVRSTLFRLWPTFQYQCMAEAKVPMIVGGSSLFTTTPPNCSCAVIDQCTSAPIPCLAPTQCYVEQFLQGFVCCPGPTNPFQSFPIANTPISNSGLLAQSIGSWGGGLLYPGSGSLTIYFGVLTYTDVCAQANWGVHAVVGCGVSNVFGSQFNTTPPCTGAVPFGTAFIDLQNALPLNNVFLPPGYGCLSVPDVVWNLTL